MRLLIKGALLFLFISGCAQGGRDQRNTFGPSLLSDEEGKFVIYAVGIDMSPFLS